MGQIIYDMTNEDYHAHKSISKSGLDLIAHSPAHYMAAKETTRKETPAMKFGTMIHTAILEPDYLTERYFAMPEKPFLRTKYGQEKKTEYLKNAKERIIVAHEEMQAAKQIMQAVSKHKIASQLFDVGIAEMSVFSEINGVNVRCRPDYMNGEIAIDLKTTDDASDSFIYSVKKYRYHVQAAFYTDILEQEGIDVSNFLFVAVEKTPPYAIGIYELGEETVNYGRRLYQDNLDTYKRCLDSGEWTGYPEIVKTLSLPHYLTAE